MQLRIAFKTVAVEKEEEESGASLDRGLVEGRVGVFREFNMDREGERGDRKQL